MAAKKKHKKYKRPNWSKIETEYVTTEISQTALAGKYNVSLRAVNIHAKQGNWVEKKEKNLQEITQTVSKETKKAIIEDKVAINKRHIALYDRALDVADYLLNQYLEDIKLVEAGEIKRGRATATNIDFLMSAIQKAQKGQRLALNIDKEDVSDNTEPEIAVIEGISLDKI